MKLFGTLLFIVSASLCAQAGPAAPWKITQPAWTESHERQFGDFVSKIGEAVEKKQCSTVSNCLQSFANYYHGSDPKGLNYTSDCADLPYYLRAYFAFKNGLPFSIIKEVKPYIPNFDAKIAKDIRYSAYGNYVTERYDILTKDGFFKKSFPDAVEVLNSFVPDVTSSAFYRMSGKDDFGMPSDFYPVSLDKKGIKPGTIIYDPNGHVALVYKITNDGRVFYIDAHPDNSMTMGMYTPKFVRSNPYQGAGFKNFRPLTLVGAKTDSAGNYIGGQIMVAKNSQLPAYSLEQFYGTVPDPAGAWNKGKFIFNNQQYNYYDYVRVKLMQGDVHIDPLNDMAQLVDDICTSLKDRVVAVESAKTDGISTKAHPDRLPYNIYGSEGEWENYATPSRDARLKTAFMDLLAETKSNLERYSKQDVAINYYGGNLAKDLFDVYARKAQECQFEYKTSNNTTVRMNLEAARQRLFNMSFDPYHCVELRWGARIDQELSSCQDSAEKRQWYENEKWLRYQNERRYDARMDYSLRELTG
ncbi:MAG: hypothetical protein ACXVCR_15835, partial [Bdellovibrio sp.]